ncbi:hypothetical protein TGRH88_008780 [Toxoplasma gondii]|uniref:Uncharacterized protein n=1 Tax=Toxoplasma gondii TaxID=5811 RepID=A0A7J6KE55_TOXGO|nr:hypothetical protein TGRH88_008780 [Toxoplasma gondii]
MRIVRKRENRVMGSSNLKHFASCLAVSAHLWHSLRQEVTAAAAAAVSFYIVASGILLPSSDPTSLVAPPWRPAC